MKSNFRILRGALFAFGWLAVSILSAAQPRKGAASEKFFYDPSLFVPEQTLPLAEIDGATLSALDGQVRALGLAPGTAFYDARVGRWSSLVVSRPLIPGSGAGNTLTWSGGLAPRGAEDWKNAAWNALLDYLRANARDLKLDLAQLSTNPRISVHGDGDLIFIHVPRVVDGIPVRDNSIGAAINHGNLILLGLQRWGDVGANVPRSPGVSAQAAEDTVRAHVQPMAVSAFPKTPRLELVPVAEGAGIGYRLVWVVSCQDHRRPRELGGPRRRVHGHAALLPGPQPVRRRNDHRRRLSGQQRPASAGRHRAARLADALRRLHDRRRQAVHRLRRQHGLHPGLDLDRAERHLHADAGFLRHDQRDRHRRHRSRRRSDAAGDGLRGARGPLLRRHEVQPLRFLRAQPHRRAGARPPRRRNQRRRLGAGPAHREHEHSERVQRLLGRLRRQLLPLGGRRRAAATRARSPRSSTTSGATAWTTTARTPTSRARARRSPTSMRPCG